MHRVDDLINLPLGSPNERHEGLFCVIRFFVFVFFSIREKREKELNEFLTQRQNRLGVRIQQRIQSINDAMTSSNLELK